MATVGSRARLSVTLYLRCLSCLVWSDELCQNVCFDLHCVRSGSCNSWIIFMVINVWPLYDNTRWFKYDRELFVCKQVTVCPGHIWTTLYQRFITNWQTSTKRSEEIRDEKFNNLWTCSLPDTVTALARGEIPSVLVACHFAERADPAPSHECWLDD
jgi:hypothetical protein